MKLNRFPAFVITALLATAAYSQSAYSDKANGFSVLYPPGFKVLKDSRAASETAFGDPGRGRKLIKVVPVSIPKKYHGDYEFSIWKSVDKKLNCGAPIAEEEVGDIPLEELEKGVARSITIAGTTFYAYSGSDGGMSKSLGLFGYRGLVKGVCWQIQSLTYQVSAFDDYKSFNAGGINKQYTVFLNSFKLF
jgi:hypothetical protein